jgi:ABC-type Fe3+/spermidine/putrescine transport system ATPase subunit
VRLRVGDAVALVLRAEALTLSPRTTAARGDLCAAHGTVADVRFAGTVVSYRVDLGDRELTVSRPPQAEILDEGAPVTVTWSPRDSILLPPEDERTP